MLGGADAQRARDLAAAMPPSCRAAAGQAPGTLLGSALDALADAAARARLTAPLLPARRGRIPARLPLAERYVMALTTADARVDVVTPEDEAEAAALAAELGAWRDGAVIPAGPVRTCFRLAEPAAPEADPWRVEFALQSADDPSLMVSAADVWAGDGAGLAAGGDPVEELLAGLGSAARLFGELDDALREAAPAEVEMDTPGAFRFLKETGPLLAGAGFGVLLPDWVRKARLGLKLTTRSRTASGTSAAGAAVARFGLGDLVDFRYDVAVGDQALDPGRAGRAGPAEGPAGPAARPVGRAGRRAPEGGAEVPRAQPGRDDDRGGRADGRDGPGTGRARERAARTRRSRWSGWTPTAGWATCCPARPTTGCGRCRPRPASPASCARTSSAGCPGCPSSASSASAASWPTTWAWARPSSCCRSSRRGQRPGLTGAAPRCWSARCRWSATGSARRRGSPRTSGCTCTTARTGWTASRSPRPWPAPTWSSPPTAWPPGTRPRSAR